MTILSNRSPITPSLTSTPDKKFIWEPYFSNKILYGGSNVKATCNSCKASICGSVHTSSNFKRHLTTLHPEVAGEYEANKRSKRYRSGTVDCFNQEQFDTRLLKFIVKTGSAFRLVEDDSFKELFNQKCNKFTVMCRETLSKRLNTATVSLVENLKTELKKYEYFCTTFDIWSHRHNSYMGSTCHVIDSEMQRRSFILHCEEFDTVHTFSNIGDRIIAVHEKFELPVKRITSTITDNAANFVKCFKEMGINGKNYNKFIKFLQLYFIFISQQDNILRKFIKFVVDIYPPVENNDEEDETINVEFTEVDEDDLSQPLLLVHERCCSHTLNLIATVDYRKILLKTHSIYQKNQGILL